MLFDFLKDVMHSISDSHQDISVKEKAHPGLSYLAKKHLCIPATSVW